MVVVFNLCIYFWLPAEGSTVPSCRSMNRNLSTQHRCPSLKLAGCCKSPCRDEALHICPSSGGRRNWHNLRNPFKNPFFWRKFTAVPSPYPRCLFSRNTNNLHCAKSKPPNDSTGTVPFTLRLKKGCFCPTLSFPFNIFCSVLSPFFEHLYLASIIGALGFQLLQNLEPGGIRWACLKGSLRAGGFVCQARRCFGLEIPASLSNPTRARVRGCSQLAVEQNQPLVLVEQGGLPPPKSIRRPW